MECVLRTAVRLNMTLAGVAESIASTDYALTVPAEAPGEWVEAVCEAARLLWERLSSVPSLAPMHLATVRIFHNPPGVPIESKRYFPMWTCLSAPCNYRLDVADERRDAILLDMR